MVVYLTTHTTTGKMYIGKDKNNHHRYFGSGTDIRRIIKEEGKVNFKKTILEECDTFEKLNEREKYWLEYFDAENNPLFYNRTNKAYGCSRQTEEGRRKIKENRTVPIYTDELRKKMGLRRIGIKQNRTKIRKDKGTIRSQEWKNAISDSVKNKPKPWKCKEVEQYDLKGNLIMVYKSAEEAKNQTKLKIQNALAGISCTSGGYIWKYQK